MTLLRPSMLACLVVLLSAGCASPNKFVGRPDVQYVDKGTLPPPGREDLILEQRSYLIGPFDTVKIDVYGVSDISQTAQVDASGKLALPLVGEIDASGRTTAELAGEIRRALMRYVRDPQVTVTADTVNQMVTVDGQVQKPGLYPVTGRMTLQRAVARAEGLTEYASANYVIVFRRVNKQQMAALYDLRAIRQGIYEDPEVFANDVIYVGENGGRRVFDAVLKTSPFLVSPLVAILQNR
ncbi:polysaccharide biosynthesis/export family protein [Sphingomonas tabacisoli]|uniref:Polysaccharide biosynthesis/export family protein n=1 Tax=Sphingomonas tabacisoli TaxID=2249466 RepID=A0ABW4I473_9SPHN